MVLTTLGKKAAPVEAKHLLERSQQETPALNDVIIGIVTSIMAYKFQQLSRKDIDTMLGITLEETRVFQEAIEIGGEREAAKLIFRLLKKRFGKELSEEMRARIQSLPLDTLENLTEDLLDFNSLADLKPWLEAQ